MVIRNRQSKYCPEVQYRASLCRYICFRRPEIVFLCHAPPLGISGQLPTTLLCHARLHRQQIKTPAQWPGFGSDADRLCGVSLLLPAPAEQTQSGEAGGEEWESRRQGFKRILVITNDLACIVYRRGTTNVHAIQTRHFLVILFKRGLHDSY